MLVKVIGQTIGRGIADKYRTESEQIKNLLSSLSDVQMLAYKDRYRDQAKSMRIGYLYWLSFGSHYLYVKRYWTQAIFWLTFGGLFGWYLLDFALMYFVVDSYNRQISFQIIDQLFNEQSDELNRRENVFSTLGEDTDANGPAHVSS